VEPGHVVPPDVWFLAYDGVGKLVGNVVLFFHLAGRFIFGNFIFANILLGGEVFNFAPDRLPQLRVRLFSGESLHQADRGSVVGEGILEFVRGSQSPGLFDLLLDLFDYHLTITIIVFLVSHLNLRFYS
jgi:hypothetical protein